MNDSAARVATPTGDTAEQAEFRRALRKFLVERSSSADVRKLMDDPVGFDPAVWRQMADQLRLQGMAIPEKYGGQGYSWTELEIVFEEMGRALLCAPYLSSIGMAAPALLRCGDESAKRDWLPRIADGTLRATLAVSEDGAPWTLDRMHVAANRDGERWLLDGVKTHVLDGVHADVILVVARTRDGVGLFLVDGSSGVQRMALDTLDPTRRLAAIRLDHAPAQLIGAESAAPLLATALDLAVTALAAEQVGGAQRCLETAVEYAGVRIQFGRPIGSFQAIKHRCAGMLLEVELARSAALAAAGAAAGDPERLPFAASCAKSRCSEAYLAVAEDNMQIHGGIGFTWEHDAHLHLRRAKSSQVLFGSPSEHRARVARIVGL